MRPTVKDVLPIMVAFRAKSGNSTGGVLHVVLDDGNIEDHHIEWCIQEAFILGDCEAVALGMRLIAMTKTQRKKLVSLFYQ
jgi:hypothetical protein